MEKCSNLSLICSCKCIGAKPNMPINTRNKNSAIKTFGRIAVVVVVYVL